MQVMCIHKGEWNKSDVELGRPSPGYLEICEVMQARDFRGKDPKGGRILPGVWYQLKGFHPASAFHSSKFITIPEATAEEMAEAERESILI